MVQEVQEIRNKIIVKSMQLFSRYGLFKTTIDEIAHALHMGKSSLYYYFKNKEDIFKAVIERELELFSEHIKKAVAEAPTPQEKLKVYAVKRMQSFKSLTNVYSALRQEYLTDYAFIKELRVDFDAREIAFVTAILQEGIAAGTFAIPDIARTAYAVVIALKGLEYKWILEGDAQDIEKDIAILHDILLYGIVLPHHPEGHP